MEYLYPITCLNTITGEFFEKGFDSFEELRKFAIKCSYSVRIKIVEYMTYDSHETSQLEYWLKKRHKK